MKSHALVAGVLAFVIFMETGISQAQTHPCDTGAAALANAHVRSNPIYAIFYGDLSSYLPVNAQHFTGDGDAIRCARALSLALSQGAIGQYDPADLQRAHQTRVELETHGIAAGPTPPTVSGMLFQLAMHIERLARVLPSATAGDYSAYYTATNEMEQLQLFAIRMLPTLLQDPGMQQIVTEREPLIRSAAESEYRLVMALAQAVARD